MNTAFLNRRELPLEDMMPIIKEHLAGGKSVRISPKGISMLPMLRQGIDKVQISPLPERLKKYDIVLYVRDDGKYVLHRIVKVKGSTYTCIGDNQFDFEKGVRYDQMIAVVTAFKRGKRVYSVDCLSYKLYCRIRHYSRPLRKVYRGFKAKIKNLF